MIEDNASPSELEVIQNSFHMGNLVLLPLSLQNDYSYRCEIDSYRQSSSRLSCGKDVSIVCVDFMDPVTKPWVLCVDRGCVITAKRKLSAVLRLFEYDVEENYLKTPISMRKAYGKVMNNDGSIVATFCPHQRYTHHRGEFVGVPLGEVENFIHLPRYVVFSGPDQKIDVVFKNLKHSTEATDTHEAILRSVMMRVYKSQSLSRLNNTNSLRSPPNFANHLLSSKRLAYFPLIKPKFVEGHDPAQSNHQRHENRNKVGPNPPAEHLRQKILQIRQLNTSFPYDQHRPLVNQKEPSGYNNYDREFRPPEYVKRDITWESRLFPEPNRNVNTMKTMDSLSTIQTMSDIALPLTMEKIRENRLLSSGRQVFPPISSNQTPNRDSEKQY